MKVLRTPEDRFADLPDFGYPPGYGDVDGVRVAYVETGPADGEPVLLLHGEPSWSFLYRKVMPVLADAGLRAIAAAAARPPHAPAGPPGDGPEVAFARSGLTVRWGAGYGSLLELAEACDVPVRWSCRTGVCHSCETALMAGTVGYSPDPIDEPAEGTVLICCSQPSADLVLDL